SSPQNSYDYTVIKYSQITGIQTVSTEIPAEFRLFQNYPNPFNPSTKIRFSVKNSSFVSLVVYNSIGELILRLAESYLKPGVYEFDWNASGLSSGAYYYRLTSGKLTEFRKMMLIK
ncbi:MAG: T9SS type A sorting domain-containing protein, partial [Ignavibacteria bacterium]|nr:T9SS type A sorting domain-containing protein [Ignavibacteria bacterium]